jgi:hypothetical protein
VLHRSLRRCAPMAQERFAQHTPEEQSVPFLRLRDAGDRRSELLAPSGPRENWRWAGRIVCEALRSVDLEGARKNFGAGGARVRPAIEGGSTPSVTGALSSLEGRDAIGTQSARHQGRVAPSASRSATAPHGARPPRRTRHLVALRTCETRRHDSAFGVRAARRHRRPRGSLVCDTDAHSRADRDGSRSSGGVVL